jgi:hypothetical protein
LFTYSHFLFSFLRRNVSLRNAVFNYSLSGYLSR